jgi:hypothetical protein
MCDVRVFGIPLEGRGYTCMKRVGQRRDIQFVIQGEILKIQKPITNIIKECKFLLAIFGECFAP